MARPVKTRDELIQSGMNMYRVMPQYKEKLASGEMSEDDLWIKAAQWADAQIEKRAKALQGEREVRQDSLQDDIKWRDAREAAYRKEFEWNDANDEASLEGLVGLEMQIRAVKRKLESPATPEVELAGLRKDFAALTKEHRTLQKDLGIDRNSRQRNESAKNVVDDWDRIKRDAREKLESLIDEFSEEAKNVSTEAELRDRLKFHFAIPFRAVDDVLSNHRRVLGLDTDVQKS